MFASRVNPEAGNVEFSHVHPRVYMLAILIMYDLYGERALNKAPWLLCSLNGVEV